MGVWVATLSHLFADMLSAPDISQPIEPLWPVINGQIYIIDIFWYSSTGVNLGMLGIGLIVNVILWYWKAR